MYLSFSRVALRFSSSSGLHRYVFIVLMSVPILSGELTRRVTLFGQIVCVSLESYFCLLILQAGNVLEDLLQVNGDHAFSAIG